MTNQEIEIIKEKLELYLKEQESTHKKLVGILDESLEYLQTIYKTIIKDEG